MKAAAATTTMATFWICKFGFCIHDATGQSECRALFLLLMRHGACCFRRSFGFALLFLRDVFMSPGAAYDLIML